MRPAVSKMSWPHWENLMLSPAEEQGKILREILNPDGNWLGQTTYLHDVAQLKYSIVVCSDPWQEKNTYAFGHVVGICPATFSTTYRFSVEGTDMCLSYDIACWYDGDAVVSC